MKVFSIALLCSPSSVVCWGSHGHKIITQLAIELMNDRGKAFISSTLGTSDLDSILEESVWADSVDAKTKYPNSWSYHFSHTPAPNCGPFDIKRDCGSGKTRGLCIVTALVDAVTMSMDVAETFDNRRDSLKFILHLMADIHQPLHTGFREDSGGLRIGLREPPGTNLHEIWDTWMVEQYMRRSDSRLGNVVDGLLSSLEFSEIAESIDASWSALERVVTVPGKLLALISEIASDTTQFTCRNGYFNPITGEMMAVDDVVNGDYFNANVQVLENRIITAATRLARLVDEIAKVTRLRRDAARSAAAAHLRPCVKLFKKREELSAISSNSFWGLPFDFDVDLIASDESLVSEKVSLSRKKNVVASAGGVAEDVLLDRAIVESNRTSFVFNDIDLGSLILIRTQRGFFVTYSQFIGRDKKFEFPKLRQPRRILFTDSLGKEKRVDLDFDHRVFPPARLDTEIIIRSVLKLKGIDPRINLVDFFEGNMSKIVVEGGYDEDDNPIVARLERESIMRFAANQARFEEMRKAGKKVPTMTSALKEYRKKICTFDINPGWTIYILSSTLIEAGDHIRLHAICMRTSRGVERALIDPRIFPGLPGFEELRTFGKLLVEIKEANKKLSHATALRRPTWLMEIEDLRGAVESRDTPFHPSCIDKAYLYRGEPSWPFEVLEWTLIPSPNTTTVRP